MSKLLSHNTTVKTRGNLPIHILVIGLNSPTTYELPIT